MPKNLKVTLNTILMKTTRKRVTVSTVITLVSPHQKAGAYSFLQYQVLKHTMITSLQKNTVSMQLARVEKDIIYYSILCHYENKKFKMDPYINLSLRLEYFVEKNNSIITLKKNQRTYAV
jgi:hypothetical protein